MAAFGSLLSGRPSAGATAASGPGEHAARQTPAAGGEHAPSARTGGSEVSAWDALSARGAGDAEAVATLLMPPPPPSLPSRLPTRLRAGPAQSAPAAGVTPPSSASALPSSNLTSTSSLALTAGSATVSGDSQKSLRAAGDQVRNRCGALAELSGDEDGFRGFCCFRENRKMQRVAG